MRRTAGTYAVMRSIQNRQPHSAGAYKVCTAHSSPARVAKKWSIFIIRFTHNRIRYNYKNQKLLAGIAKGTIKL